MWSESCGFFLRLILTIPSRSHRLRSRIIIEVAAITSRDFFGPALSVSTLYRRSVGYFTTSALVAWADSLIRMAENALAVRLIASPELSAADLSVLRDLQTPEAKARKQGARGGGRLRIEHGAEWRPPRYPL